MSNVIILRGLPGSGKSQIANQLSHSTDYEMGGLSVGIVSADDFFIDPSTRQYNWYADGIREAHKVCYEKFIGYITQDYDLIIVDNTNALHKEYSDYYRRRIFRRCLSKICCQEYPRSAI
jgi:tRNA uridine 5-carbamoylmethylation protein Kti12